MIYRSLFRRGVALFAAGFCLLEAGRMPARCAENVEQMVKNAAGLYSTRHVNPANLQESEKLLREALAAAPANPVVCAELAHVCYLLGDSVANGRTAAGKNEKLGWYEQGITYAKKAVELDDAFCWAHLWYAVNLGRVGQTKGVLNSLFMVPDIRRETEKALALNPSLAPALDVRGVLNYEVPALFGGDLAKSIDDLQKAIEADPAFTLPYIDLADAYLRKKDYARARQCLERALRVPAPTYEADYVLWDRPRALRLLKKIEGK